MCQWLMSDRKPPATPQHTLEQHIGRGDSRGGANQSFHRDDGMANCVANTRTILLSLFMHSNSAASHCAADKEQFQRSTGRYKQRTE